MSEETKKHFDLDMTIGEAMAAGLLKLADECRSFLAGKEFHINTKGFFRHAFKISHGNGPSFCQIVNGAFLGSGKTRFCDFRIVFCIGFFCLGIFCFLGSPGSELLIEPESDN